MSGANAERTAGLHNRIRGFLQGLCTWAEAEGMTAEEALAVAELGCELAGVGRLEEACVLFEGLVSGNPQDASARAALGTLYQKLGRVPEALEEYSAALALEPTHPVALSNRGELRLRQGELEGWEDIQHAVRADPRGRTFAAQRARALLEALEHTAASSNGLKT